VHLPAGGRQEHHFPTRLNKPMNDHCQSHPKQTGGLRYLLHPLVWLLLACAAAPPATASEGNDRQALLNRLEEKTRVTEVKPSVKGGRAVRLVYYVPVSAEVFWKFKTDFDNDWLVTNKYIQAHRFISRHDNVVITETKYTYGPDVYFRWETLLYPEARILRYTLLNPEECGQEFNHGWIRIDNAGELVRVRHTSYFDFTGAFLWTHLPGPWGMTGFLRYTARWEQQTILHRQFHYQP